MKHKFSCKFGKKKKNMQKSYAIIGIMSGTSTDGIDVAYVNLVRHTEKETWDFELLHTHTYPFRDELANDLKNAKSFSGLELKELDLELGDYFADCVLDFLKRFSINQSAVNAIASHGHTIFHQPSRGITVQIGNGQLIATKTGIRVINNFREKDVLNGGQGAPLVPIGDKLLFANHADTFLNLGGFANLTKIDTHSIIAYDICPCNLPLNQYARLIGYPYDHNGELGRAIYLPNPGITATLDAIPYYSAPFPKSLGTEWLEAEFFPIIDIDELTAQEKLRICYEHISGQIARALVELKSAKVLITGGGAKNKFLVDLIREKSKAEIIIPSPELVDFKESLVFAFLGALYLEGLPNCLSMVTGAKKDVSGGQMFHP
jgi:anhydro-N-acetylmuramic acid kinase